MYIRTKVTKRSRTTKHLPASDRKVSFTPTPTRLQILIFCKRAKKEINIQYKYVYLQAHKEKGR